MFLKTKPTNRMSILFVTIAVLAMLTACGSDDDPIPTPTPTPTPTPAPSADTTPDPFSFAAATNVGLDFLVASEAVTITGIDTATPISVTDGEYSIDGGDFTAEAGTITNDQTVTVRLTSPSALSETAQATLDVGGVTATFNTTNASFNINLAVYAEAEGGDASTLISMGSSFSLVDGYVTTTENGTDEPTDDNRVIELEITFPGPGMYELYTLLRVGPGAGGDDSFYAPNVLGSNDGWILANGISGFIIPGEAGYEADIPVIGGGSGQTEVWKWYRLAALTYDVAEGDLIQTFRFASREDGLDIDKFAFAQVDIQFTVDQLHAGLPGGYIAPPVPYIPEGPAIAEGMDKFLGGVCCGAQGANFTEYWNQVTPENGGKWGSVEGVRDTYNWGGLDAAYAMAKDNGLIFKMHVLVWGNQQPGWIADLPMEEQLEEIIEWFDAVSERYDDFDFIEVVNEFDNDPPDDQNNGPGYIDALRFADPETTTELIAQFMEAGENEEAATARAADYDWIINSFQMARDRFPATAKLMINEYSVINTGTRTTTMMELVTLLQERDLIDAVGFQGHAFSTTGNIQIMSGNIDRLATLGLDLYVTELDIDGSTDNVQLIEYQRVFPMMWEHPAIKGITVWGYLPGHWREDEGAHLAIAFGYEKPALMWLRSYVTGTSPVIEDTAGIGSGEVLAEETEVGTEIVTLSATAPSGDDIEWSIVGGNRSESYTIDAATGVLTTSATLIGGENQIFVQAKAGRDISMLKELIFAVPGEVIIIPPSNTPPVTFDFTSGLDGWRGDYGTNAVLTLNATEGAEVTSDWTAAAQFIIGQIQSANYTGAHIEYTVTVTQAQVDEGITAQGAVQTGAPNGYARIYDPVIHTLVAGENVFTYIPVDTPSGDLLVIERVAISFGGLMGSSNTDPIFINNVAVTFPKEPVVFDFTSGLDGWRGDYGTDTVLTLNATEEAAEVTSDWDAENQFIIGQIDSANYTGTTIEYTVTVTQAQVDLGITAQAAVQTGAVNNYARIYDPTAYTLVAGENFISYMPVDTANNDLLVIERIAIQFSGLMGSGNTDPIFINDVTVNFQ